MGMSGSQLATDIRTDMGFPAPNSAQLIGWGNAVVQEIQQGIVNNALVTGTCPPSGGDLIQGASMGGIISALVGSRLASSVKSQSGYPSISSKLTAFCNQIVSHVMSQGLVNFDPGNITGTCTNTPLSPGALVAGAGTNGKITGLNGSQLANNIHSAAGYPGSTSTRLIGFCTAIVTHIMSNAQVSYQSGTVTGPCPTGGGAFNGAAVTGQIA